MLSHLSSDKGLCAAGVVDERTLTLLFLTVERYSCIMKHTRTVCSKLLTQTLSNACCCRQLGTESVWHPWLNMLQKNPPVPLFYR